MCFPGDGPTFNANPPSIVGYPTVPQVQRRPLYNKFSYPGYIDPSTGTTLMCCSTDQGNYLGSDSSSNYNALQVKVEKRFSHGLQFLSHYTFADAYKYDNNYYAISPGIAYGPDDQVRNQVWVNNVVYALPFGRGQPFGGERDGLRTWSSEAGRSAGRPLGAVACLGRQASMNAAPRRMCQFAVPTREPDPSTQARVPSILLPTWCPSLPRYPISSLA
jgi:hypothetical protein